LLDEATSALDAASEHEVQVLFMCVCVRARARVRVCDIQRVLQAAIDVAMRDRTVKGFAHLALHASLVTTRTSHNNCHTSHVTRHTSHVTRHTSHVTPHTSHLTPHTSHLIPHTSHLTRRPPCPCQVLLIAHRLSTVRSAHRLSVACDRCFHQKLQHPKPSSAHRRQQHFLPPSTCTVQILSSETPFSVLFCACPAPRNSLCNSAVVF